VKSIFDNVTRQELLDRISLLSDNSQALWGEMSVHQMVQHCIRADDMMQGTLQVKRALIGRIFGRLILRGVLKDDAPFRKNTPTVPELKTQITSSNLDEQMANWHNRINSYKHYSNSGLVHPFFGPMTREQVGQLVYKHYDHHLRQFGV